jgi:predicted ATPase/class 3 adenylate cyclase
MDMPTGAVTLLFTDVEGSTRKWEEHPAAMSVALPRHDFLMRQAIESRGGFVFKTVGDAFCAAFSDPSEAATAALDCQRALDAEPWPLPAPLRVRMGLHTGVCDERDGDYFGPTVNRAARLAATAHGGQTVVSASTAALLRPSLSGDVSLLDLGEHRLKDLGQPEWVFQLVATGLQRDFPPLRSAGLPRLRHNLPAPLTSFVGRSRELAEIRALRRESRLVTLTGSGGAGKTRLALQLANDDLEETTAGVWLVELAAIREEELVVATAAAAADVREEPGRPIIDSFVDALRARRALLVLDNCEHVVKACAELTETLLRSCPEISILATSREPLAIPSERIYRVPSLSVPRGGEDLRDSEAAQLFFDRARQQVPDLEPTGALADAVTSICRQLDGIPLALELAAASLRRLSVTDIAERLDNRFRLLTGGSRTAMPRQQTLRATVDWSFDLLGPAEMRTLSRLSVFVDGWSLQAAERVCANDDVSADEIVEVLGILVDKSLVQAEPSGSGMRFRLLETIRHYAAEKLLGYGEAEVMASRWAHAQYFVLYAEAAAAAAELSLDDSGAVDWLDDLDLERPNIRAVTRFCLGREDGAELALRSVVAMRRFWQVRGDVAEGLELVRDVLDHPGARPRSRLRAAALLVVADLNHVGGHFAGAVAPLKEGIDISRDVGDPLLTVDLLATLCLTSAVAGDLAVAKTAANEAVELARARGDATHLGTALDFRSVALAMSGDEAAARSNAAEALALFRSSRAPLGQALALMHLSLLDMAAGNLAAARAALTEALDFSEALRADGLTGYVTLNLGVAELLDAEIDTARESFDRCLAEALRVGNRSSTAHAILGLALCRAEAGEDRLAARMHGCAQLLLHSLDVQWGIIESQLSASLERRLRLAIGDAVFESESERGRDEEPVRFLQRSEGSGDNGRSDGALDVP